MIREHAAALEQAPSSSASWRNRDRSSERFGEAPRRVLFAGGGSGGHLRPGLDVAGALVALAPRSEVRFAVTRKPLDAEIVRTTPFSFEVLAAPRFRRTPSGVAGAVMDFGRGIHASLRLLGTFRPDLVVALGGHGCVAPALAARMRGVTVALLEQNRTPGRANRLLAQGADAVFVPFEESCAEFIHPDRVEVLGNPVRVDLVFEGGACEARERLGLRPDLRTLLVVGGSQGSVGINARVAAALRAGSSCVDFQAIHLAGSAEAVPPLEKAYAARGVAARVLSFSTEMPVLYAAADLVLSRAGGTTIAELAAIGKPAVLVPFPHHADRHQERNAEVLTTRGAARIVHEGDLTPEVFDSSVLGLLADDAAIAAMAKASRALGRPDAARRVARRILDLASHEGRS
ncbi:MAG: UDP-N-acetylglucosamine--N-acetylmuramyl-(pentapeptide) pyrophosphoryl-undecaprenol N-acetylglucosamine transferase [Planctomycetes bacterium]|nr:UDP-N-acetylglucosamine--N-acetylmuramyl-(pentapeptide) pyrophosphoryl-undecaprenol N-acetylglucosamine transferase [Planctomycetota bacterium]MBI3844418.1 UDP-N-acetylglucosamine--N-acetylmuramyl-(pentapeptide) pyrophosphoryl-undecaprenol N-acetylglucosamine transferase [Planctomycetota bacterium]